MNQGTLVICLRLINYTYIDRMRNFDVRETSLITDS